MQLKIDNLESEEIAEFLEQHIQEMRATSPPESVHALDLNGLRVPEITPFGSYVEDPNSVYMELHLGSPQLDSGAIVRPRIY